MEYIPQRLQKKLKRYAGEIVLLLIAISIPLFAFFVFPEVQTEIVPTEVLSATTKNGKVTVQEETDTVYVEVSGAVKDPNVYKVRSGTRLKEVIDLAGGLSDVADSYYVARNYNLAKIVGDQEKIYIPYLSDIQSGIFIEKTRTLEYLQPVYSTQLSTGSNSPKASTSDYNISLNEASQDELDTLPGVGPVTAQKIIDNRPYSTVEELLEKKVVKQSVFDQIYQLVGL